jgi:hypothetical protein
LPDRLGFALLLADRSGLDPEVTLGWTYFETSDATEPNHPYNWINWKDAPDLVGPFVSHWPASDGGTIPGYANLHDAVDDCERRLALPKYDAIRASAGKGAAFRQPQLDAIIASKWGTKNLQWIAYHVDSHLMWTWISWRLGRDWAREFGPRSVAHRPYVFPTGSNIPASWWDELAKFH